MKIQEKIDMYLNEKNIDTDNELFHNVVMKIENSINRWYKSRNDKEVKKLIDIYAKQYGKKFIQDCVNFLQDEFENDLMDDTKIGTFVNDILLYMEKKHKVKYE